MIHTPPKRIGPYEDLQLLGQGGIGRVYRAVHRAQGHQVALKVMRRRQARALSSMQRELRALQRVQHPGVVRVLDGGVDQDRPWIAMELLQGQTLGDHLRAHTSSPPPRPETNTLYTDPTQLSSPHDPSETLWTLEEKPDRAFQSPLERKMEAQGQEKIHQWLCWASDIAETLHYIHNCGFAHLDIKPDNILITPDGRPVILDFGLARHFEERVNHEDLENAGILAGTMRYIAPERALMGVLDARADLYAMGCILYRMVTGRPPFTGDSEVVLQQHISTPPIPPTRLGAPISSSLERLILALLSKAPYKRPPHAQTIVQGLNQEGFQGLYSGTAPPPAAHLYRSTMIGRERVLQSILGDLQGAQKGQFCMTLLEGDAGVGKSKVAESAIMLARRAGMRVLVCKSSDQNLPMGTWDALFAELGQHCAAESARAIQIVQDHPSLLHYSPTLRALAKAEVLPKAATPQIAENLARALCESLSLLAVKPLLLVFDDLHRADPMSRRVLEIIAQSAPEAPVMVLGLYRTESAVFAHLKPSPTSPCTTHRLQNLDRETVGEILGRMMSSHTRPQPLIEHFVKASGGNPLFAVEYLRLAVDQGALYANEDGLWQTPPDQDLSSLPTPQTVRELLQEKVDALPQNLLETTQIAALLGQGIHQDILLEVSGMKREKLQDTLHTLEDRAILKVERESLHFTHDELREVAYQRASRAWKHALHHKTAALLKTQKSHGRKVDLHSLAEHLEASGEQNEACQTYMECAEHNARRFALDAARTSFERAIALADPTKTIAVRSRWRMAKTVLLHQNRLDAARSLLNEAIHLGAQQKEVEERACALMALAQLDAMQSNLNKAERHLEDARRLLQRAQLPRRLASALVTSGIIAYMRGSHQAAQEHWETGLRIANTVPDEELKAVARQNLALLYRSQGLLQDALRIQHNAREDYKARGHLEGEGNACNNILDILCLQGRFGELFKTTSTRAKVIWKTLRSDYSLAYLLHTTGKSHRVRGDLDKALQDQQESLRLRRDGRDRINELDNHLELLKIKAETTTLGAAMTLWTEIHQTFQGTSNLSAWGRFLILGADLHRRAFQIPQARDLIAEARQMDLPEVEDRAELLIVLAKIDLAEHKDPSRILQKIHTLCAPLELRPESELAQKKMFLEAATSASDVS